MIDLWIPRPLQQGLITQAKLDPHKFNVICEQLMQIDYIPIKLNSSNNYQAVILTSQHSVPALNSLNNLSDDIKVLTVGTTTYTYVRELNRFKNIYTANGNHQDLALLIAQHCHPQGQPLLYLHGYHYTAQFEVMLNNLNFQIEKHICYHAHAVLDLSSKLIKLIQSSQDGIILIYSARQSDILISLIKKNKLENFIITWSVIVISGSCAVHLKSLQFKNIIVSPAPDDETMIKTVEKYNGLSA